MLCAEQHKFKIEKVTSHEIFICFFKHVYRKTLLKDVMRSIILNMIFSDLFNCLDGKEI